MVSSLVQKSVAMKIQHESEAGSLAYLRYLLTGQFHLSRSVLSAGAVWGGGSSTLSSVDPPRESQTWDRNEPHGGALFLGVNKWPTRGLWLEWSTMDSPPNKPTKKYEKKQQTSTNKHTPDPIPMSERFYSSTPLSNCRVRVPHRWPFRRSRFSPNETGLNGQRLDNH